MDGQLGKDRPRQNSQCVYYNLATSSLSSLGIELVETMVNVNVTAKRITVVDCGFRIESIWVSMQITLI